MMVLLYCAAAVFLYLGEETDAIAILTIAVLNALLGSVQDCRAEKAPVALKQLAVPNVRVRRNGVLQEASSRDLVAGDVGLLEAENFVPADCRVVEATNLAAQDEDRLSQTVGDVRPAARDDN